MVVVVSAPVIVGKVFIVPDTPIVNEFAPVELIEILPEGLPVAVDASLTKIVVLVILPLFCVMVIEEANPLPALVDT